MRDRARGQTRGIDDDVDLLRALDLKNFGDGLAAARGGFPVNLIETVAWSIFAQLFEFAAAAQLAQRRAMPSTPRRRAFRSS